MSCAGATRQGGHLWKRAASCGDLVCYGVATQGVLTRQGVTAHPSTQLTSIVPNSRNAKIFMFITKIDRYCYLYDSMSLGYNQQYFFVSYVVRPGSQLSTNH